METFFAVGNDARNIALRRRSDLEKTTEVDELANKFCDLLESRILAASPHICVLISMLLPRNDYSDRHGLSNPNIVRRCANVQITTRLYKHPRVFLINSDPILDWNGDETRFRELYQSDGYHLTPYGFGLMTQNWIDNLLPHVRGKEMAVAAAAAVVGPATVVNPLLDIPERTAIVPETSTSLLLNGDEDGDVTLQPTLLSVVEVDVTVPDPFGSYTGMLVRRFLFVS